MKKHMSVLDKALLEVNLWDEGWTRLTDAPSGYDAAYTKPVVYTSPEEARRENLWGRVRHLFSRLWWLPFVPFRPGYFNTTMLMNYQTRDVFVVQKPVSPDGSPVESEYAYGPVPESVVLNMPGPVPKLTKFKISSEMGGISFTEPRSKE